MKQVILSGFFLVSLVLSLYAFNLDRIDIAIWFLILILIERVNAIYNAIKDKK